MSPIEDRAARNPLAASRRWAVVDVERLEGRRLFSGPVGGDGLGRGDENVNRPLPSKGTVGTVSSPPRGSGATGRGALPVSVRVGQNATTVGPVAGTFVLSNGIAPISYALSGTARFGVDYMVTTTTGGTAATGDLGVGVVVTIHPIADPAAAVNETVVIRLVGDLNGTVGNTATATMTLTNPAGLGSVAGTVTGGPAGGTVFSTPMATASPTPASRRRRPPPAGRTPSPPSRPGRTSSARSSARSSRPGISRSPRPPASPSPSRPAPS